MFVSIFETNVTFCYKNYGLYGQYINKNTRILELMFQNHGFFILTLPLFFAKIYIKKRGKYFLGV